MPISEKSIDFDCELECDMCEQSVNLGDDYLAHLKIVHGIKKNFEFFEQRAQNKIKAGKRKKPGDDTQLDDEVKGLDLTPSSAAKEELKSVSPKLDIHTCPNCGKQFGKKWNLQRHMKSCSKSVRQNVDKPCDSPGSKDADNSIEQILKPEVEPLREGTESVTSNNAGEKMEEEESPGSRDAGHSIEQISKPEDEPLSGGSESVTSNNAGEKMEEEESDTDYFEMFICEACDKYFVSQESLENHQSQCKAETKEVPIVEEEMATSQKNEQTVDKQEESDVSVEMDQTDYSTEQWKQRYPGLSIIPKVNSGLTKDIEMLHAKIQQFASE